MKAETVDGLSSLTDHIIRVSGFLAASLIISMSSAIGLRYAFEARLLPVFVCLWGFLIGFTAAKVFVHTENYSRSTVYSSLGRIREFGKVDYLSLLGGSAFMSLGFVILAKSISELSPLLGLTAAIVMGAGYILAHWALNNTLV